MTHIQRSRRLQAGLAGLSVVSALGTAVGLGLTTHTGTSRSASQANDGSTGSGSTTSGSTTSRSHDSGEGDDGTGSRTPSNRASTNQSSPVTPPSNSAPQATTSGS